MREGAGLDCCDLREIRGAKHFDQVKSANRYISELAAGSAYEIDVIGDRAGIKHLYHFERWLGIEDHYLADVFECKPNLFPIRCGGNVGTEWTFLLHSADNLFGGRGYSNCLRTEAGANVPIFAVRGKDRHARPIGHFDTRLFTIGLAVQDRDIILPADADPNLFAIWREKCLVWRPPHVGHMLYGITCRVDKADRV